MVLVNYVRDEQIGQSIAVHISPADPHIRRCPGLRKGNAAQGRLLLKRSVMLIDPKMVCHEVVGNKDVGPGIAVEVSAQNSKTLSFWTVH